MIYRLCCQQHRKDCASCCYDLNLTAVCFMWSPVEKLDTLHNSSHINLQNLMKLIVYLKNHPHCYTFWWFCQVLLAFIISLNVFVVHWLGPFVMRSTCRYCHGTRMYIKFPRTECEGKGSTVQRKKVTVPVPAGKKSVMHDVDCSV
jgi:hypothetical protein